MAINKKTSVDERIRDGLIGDDFNSAVFDTFVPFLKAHFPDPDAYESGFQWMKAFLVSANAWLDAGVSIKSLVPAAREVFTTEEELLAALAELPAIPEPESFTSFEIRDGKIILS